MASRSETGSLTRSLTIVHFRFQHIVVCSTREQPTYPDPAWTDYDLKLELDSYWQRII